MLQVPCLTAGMPTPDAIAQQKENYARALEEQLRKGVELLGETHKEKTDHLHQSANKNKQQYNLMLDQQVKQHEMTLSQQYNHQLMMLQQAAQQQRAELDQQAAALVLEWQQRQTQQEFMKESMGIRKRYDQVQKELAHEMQKVGSTSTTGAGSMALSIGGSRALSAAGSMHLPIGAGSAQLPIGAVPLAKYELPANLRSPSNSRSAGSCTMPPATYMPGVYMAPRQSLSRPSSYVPPASMRSLSTDSRASGQGSGVPTPAPGMVTYSSAGSLTVPLGRAPGPSRGGSTAMPMGSGGSAQLPIGRSAALPAGAVVYGALAGSHVLPVGGGAVRYAQASAGSHALPVGGGGTVMYTQAITQAAAAQAAAAKAAAEAAAEATEAARFAEDGSLPPTPMLPDRGG